jgi:cytochrome c551/c552
MGCNDQAPIPKQADNNNTGKTDSPIGVCAWDKPGGSEDFFHVDQSYLTEQATAGKNLDVFKYAFGKGDILFGTFYTQAQGGGAKVDGSERYTRMPRADATGDGEWARHDPLRATGPNAQACVECHNLPGEDGAGGIVGNVHRDQPFPGIGYSGDPKRIIQRNTPHLFGLGALQRLAEEMTAEIKAQQYAAAVQACQTKQEVKQDLSSKGVSFGHLTLNCDSGSAVIVSERSKIEGVEPDLVVRPYEWKKSVAFVRDFMRGASHNEIGMQAVEIVGKGKDGDGDGQVDELSVGDMTAFTVYMAAQPRPTTRLELDKLGLIKPLKADEREQIGRGGKLFADIGCAACHQPKLMLQDPIFKEPSQSADYRDNPGDANGIPVNLRQEGVDPAHPVTFDLSHDQQDNILCKNGKEIRLGAFEKVNGQTVVELYGDLKRHYMGPRLAEPINEIGTGHMGYVPFDKANAVMPHETPEEEGTATFGTKELWGTACTGPWMHDGRASTLREAILLHGGEAEKSAQAFGKLEAAGQKDVLAFLGNLVIYLKKAGEQELGTLADSCEVKD